MYTIQAHLWPSGRSNGIGMKYAWWSEFSRSPSPKSHHDGVTFF
jgi:hypothetical protein